MRVAALALLAACGGRVELGATYEGGFYEENEVAVSCPDGYPAIGRWGIEQDSAGRVSGNYLLCGGWIYADDLVGVADGDQLRFVVRGGSVRIDARRSPDSATIRGAVSGLGPGVTFAAEKLAGAGGAHVVRP